MTIEGKRTEELIMHVHRRSHRQRRRGSVLVEFAITAPVLFAVFGFMWEFSRAEMIRQTAASAAYEGARRAIVVGGSAGDAEAAANEIISAVGISGAEVTVTPASITNETPSVQVDVTVPLNGNTYVAPFFLQDLELSSQITLSR